MRVHDDGVPQGFFPRIWVSIPEETTEPPEITSKLPAAKKPKHITFADIGKDRGRNKCWVAALFYHQAKATDEEIPNLAKLVELPPDELNALADFSTKGTDPLIYRLYEFIQLYGMPIKAVIHEKFGDGIMNHVDFTVHVDKEPDPKVIGWNSRCRASSRPTQCGSNNAAVCAEAAAGCALRNQAPASLKDCFLCDLHAFTL